MEVTAPRPFDGNDEFYRRVNRHNWKKNKVNPGVFKPKTGEWLSIDWANLTTPEECAERGDATHGPTRVAVVSAPLVWILGLEIKYSWKPSNPAHCEITGEHLSSPSALQARKVLARESRVLGPF